MPDDKAERDAFYRGARWKRLRASFLANNPLCADCLARDGRPEAATVAHHQVERLQAPELAYVESNLVALCNPCHTLRHKSRGGRPHGR